MFTAIVLIDVEASRIPEAAAAIGEVPGVSEVYSVTGDVDLIAMVRVREHHELADVIADHVSKVDGVLRTQTLIRLLPSKENYFNKASFHAIFSCTDRTSN